MCIQMDLHDHSIRHPFQGEQWSYSRSCRDVSAPGYPLQNAFERSGRQLWPRTDKAAAASGGQAGRRATARAPVAAAGTHDAAGGTGRSPRGHRARTGLVETSAAAARPSPPARRSPRRSRPSSSAPEIRSELITLDKSTADVVARHLVAAGELLDDDPAAALEHARAARARSGRIAAVREAVGIAAYHCGDWAQALAELRAARRMGSKSALLPLIADCERGVGRPERAIELARSAEAAAAHRRRCRRTAHRRRRRPLRPRAARAGPGGAVQPAAGYRRAPGRPLRDCSTPTPRRCWRSGRTDEALQCVPQRRRRRRRRRHRRRRARRRADLTWATLAQEHDCLLLDLDGTVFRGHEPTDGAVESLAAVQARALYVTNNASRRPAEVADPPSGTRLRGRTRRRRHQRAERCPAAGRPAARRRHGPRRRYRFAGRRDRARSA